jgi:putative two-component system response regulator
MLACPGSDGQILEGLWAGADDFLVKPFDPQELVVRVKTGQRVLALEAHDVALFAIARLAESRGPEAEGHLERVRMYSQVLADRLSETARPGYAVDAAFIRLIYRTSPLHDVGKLGIRDAIVLKPARLTTREFDIMKTHTLIGAATLDTALHQHPEDAFLAMARAIAMSHHEWVNGTGYPHGLRGARIPLAARIVAVADAYDALTTERPYRPPFRHEQACAVIAAESGAHFDREVVVAFGACEAIFNQIRRTYGQPRDAAV